MCLTRGKKLSFKIFFKLAQTHSNNICQGLHLTLGYLAWIHSLWRNASKAYDNSGSIHNYYKPKEKYTGFYNLRGTDAASKMERIGHCFWLRNQKSFMRKLTSNLGLLNQVRSPKQVRRIYEVTLPKWEIESCFVSFCMEKKVWPE